MVDDLPVWRYYVHYELVSFKWGAWQVAITNEGESEDLIESVTAADFGILLSENNCCIFTPSHTATYYIQLKTSHLHATDILQ